MGGRLEVTDLPGAQAVEIVEQSGSIYLLRMDEGGQCVADTWHATMESAKEQARVEYGIEDSDWAPVQAE